MKLKLTALLIGFASLAKAQLTPEFEFQLGNTISKVKWLQQTNTGSLVAATDAALVGIDPKTKQISWQIKELGSAEEKNFENIPGTPYFLIETAKSFGLGTPQTSIVEAETGKLIFNSSEAEMKISAKRPLYQLNSLLIEGKKAKRNFISLIDFSTGKERWTKDMGEAKGGFGIGAMVRKIKAAMNSIFSIPTMVDGKGNLVIVDKDEVVCLNGETGAEMWKKKFKEKIGDAQLTYDKSKLFLSYENKVDLLTTADGMSAYGEKLLKLKGDCNGLAPYDASTYVVKHSNGINLLDVATGALKWNKESDIESIDDVRLTDHGIVSIKTGEKEAIVWMVGNDGKKTWKVEFGDPLLLIEPTPSGLVYFTAKRANLIDYKTGKELWKRDIKIKAAPSFAFDNQRNRLVVFSDEKLYIFNNADGNMTVLNEEIKLKDYDEEKELAKIEVRGNGYFINTAQNAALTDFDGKVIYNNFYREAGMGKGARALMGLAGSAASMYAAKSSLSSLRGRQATDANGKPVANTIEVYQDENSSAYRQAAASSEASSGLFAAAAKRYSATKQTKEDIYILTKFEDGTNGLVKIAKSSGKTAAQIPFGDKEPSYVIDEAENKLYVIVKDKFVQGYKL